MLQRSWSSTLRELCLVGGHHLTDTALEGIGERLHGRQLTAGKIRTMLSVISSEVLEPVHCYRLSHRKPLQMPWLSPRTELRS